MPMVMTKSRKTKFLTLDFVSDGSKKTKLNSIDQVSNQCKCRGFKIRSLKVDNEFADSEEKSAWPERDANTQQNAQGGDIVKGVASSIGWRH